MRLAHTSEIIREMTVKPLWKRSFYRESQNNWFSKNIFAGENFTPMLHHNEQRGNSQSAKSPYSQALKAVLLVEAAGVEPASENAPLSYLHA